MSLVSDFFKSSGFYFLGNVLSKLIMFFLLPVYTLYISAESLGYYDLSYTYLNLVVTFLFVDIYVGIMRFIFDENTPSDPGKTIFNGLIIFNSSLAFYTATAAVLWLFFDIPYIGYVYLWGVCLTVNNLLGYLARALGHNKLFAATGVVGTLVACLLNVIGVAVLKGGIEVLYIASIAGLLVQVVLLERRIRIRHYFSFRLYDRDLLLRLFRYSIPLSLNSLAFWLLTGYTNVMISGMLGLEANGIYLVATKFGMAINLLANCFNLAWQEIAFKKGNENKQQLSLFYSRAVNLLILFFGLGGIGLVSCSHLIFPFMVKGVDYLAAFDIVPLYIVVAILSVISLFLGQIYAALKETKLIMYSTLVACTINLALVPLFITLAGLGGAIVAMIISYLVNVVMRTVLLRKYVNISLNYKKLLFLFPLIIATFAVYYAGSFLGNAMVASFVLVLSLIVFWEYLKPVVARIRPNKKC